MGQSPVWTMWLSEAWVITSTGGEGLSKPGAGSPEAGKGTWGQWYGGTCKEAAACLPARDMRDPHMPTELRPRRRLIQVSPPWGSERTVAPVRDPGQWPQVPVCCYKAKSLAREQLSAGRRELIPRSSLTMRSPSSRSAAGGSLLRAGRGSRTRSAAAKRRTLPSRRRAVQQPPGPEGH